MANPTVIVGAGLAGLTAANRLHDAGRQVVVLESEATPGGRLSTRAKGSAVLDLGAQFFTVRSAAFADFVAPLIESGLVLEWCRGFNVDDGYPRYRVEGGMQQLGRHLAEGLDVRVARAVTAVRPTSGQGTRRVPPPRYEVDVADGSSITADAVVLTPPVPLVVPLLYAGGIPLDPAIASLTYHRVLALLVTLDRPSGVPAPGGHQSEDGPFSFIGDNYQKGISETVAVTFHTNHALSAEHWDDEDADVMARLLAMAEPWLAGAIPQSVDLLRWPYAGPLTPWPHAVAEVAENLLIAGDAFAGPKVEGAFLSGSAAAAFLLEV